jgi:hypothetical protein
MESFSIAQIASQGASDWLKDWLLERCDDDESVEYETVLAQLAESDRPDEAFWLLDTLGASAVPIHIDTRWDENRDVKHVFSPGDLYIKGDLTLPGYVCALGRILVVGQLTATQGIRSSSSLKCTGDLRTCGDLEVKGRIDVENSLVVGRDIECGFGITIGGDLRVGGGIRAGRRLLEYQDAVATILEFDHPKARDIHVAVELVTEGVSGLAEPWAAFIEPHGPFELQVGGILEVEGVVDYELNVRCGRLKADADRIRANQLVVNGSIFKDRLL